MCHNKMKISEGVAALLANAQQPMPNGECYFFEGDLCQMATAVGIARYLGIGTGIAGGLPYVKSKEEYNKVVKYIVDHKIEGYWHYQ